MKNLTLISLFLLSQLLCFQSIAGEYRFRARENYEIIDSKYLSQEIQYKGFSNTVNFWYEEPNDIAIGLAGGVLLGTYSTSDHPTNGLEKDLKLFFLGAETKYFYSDTYKSLFTRIGLYFDSFDTKGIRGKLNGWSYYAGFGWEGNIFSNVSLAPEIGIRQGDASGFYFTSFSISIGLHFNNFNSLDLL